MSTASGTNNPVFAVIMAGGSGTRFWPYSRRRRPKHLLEIFGGTSLLQETVSRLGPLIPPERILVVTAREHARAVICQLPELPGENIIIEPVGRNTAPCIGLAAEYIQRRAKDAIMVALPADQLINDRDGFRRTLAFAIETAILHESLITIGMEPTAPETGYGYIQTGELAEESKGNKAYQVRAFREKPSPALAREFLSRGDHLWNSGIFIWQVKVIREALKKYLPALSRLLGKIGPAMGTTKEKKTLASCYRQMEGVSIDYGVMEKADKVLVIPGGFDWRDMGSWDAFWELADKDPQGNAVKSGNEIVIDTKNCLAVSPGKLVALVGVEDLLVVETKDTLLVCKRGRSQEMRAVTDALAGQGKKEYL
ncbi:MAG: mannose-1-phosphate guanylyltransferase [Smithellaceae bacterium]|nr:mannose-1-phosphate guanylyltransferase [Smithellaceae bacterium]